MKIASNPKLSLRKLLIATLAIGPLAVLPSPVWATLPTAGSYSVGSGPVSATFTVTNGQVNVTNTGSTSILSAQDKSVLVWGYANSTATQTTGTFNIGATDTYNFSLPSSTSAVLNKVGYSPLTAQASGADNAVIAGTLTSNGKVFILANGNINLASTATVSTAGLVLSTLQETNDAAFTSGGTLALTGSPLGNVTIGSVGGVNGDLSAYTGNFSNGTVDNVNGGTMATGNLLLKAVTAGAGINFATALTVSAGNLTVITNNGAISQTATFPITANGLASNATVTTLSTGSTGTNGITLNESNNFSHLALTSNGTVSITNANTNGTIIDASSLTNSGASLTISSTNNISTSGAVAVAGNATFATTAANKAITIANNSSVGGNLILTGTGSTTANYTFNGTGNLKLGNGSTDTFATGGSGNVIITTTGSVVTNNNITTTGNVIITATTINQTLGNIGISGGAAANVTTLNATSGTVRLGNITTNRISVVTANSTIDQASGSSLVTKSTTVTQNNTFNAGTATVTLNNTGNNFWTGPSLQLTAGSGNVITGNSVNVGTTNVSGNYTLATNTNATNIVLGGDPALNSLSQNILVTGLFKASTLTTGTITDNPFSSVQATGGIDLSSGSGAISLTAGTAHGSLSPLQNYGTINLSTTGAGSISETNTLNLGNVSIGTTLSVNSTKGDIVQNGNVVTATTATFNVATSGNSITLNGGNNSIGTVNFIGGANNSYTGNNAFTLGSSTSMSSGNLTVTSTGSSSDITVTSPAVANLVVNSANSIIIGGATTAQGNVTLNASGTGTGTGTESIRQGANALTVTGGTTTIKSAGDVNLGGAANDFSTVSLNVTGNVGVVATPTVGIRDINSLVLSGSTGGDLMVQSGNAAGFTAPWTLTIGNLSTGGNLSLTAMNGDSTNAGAGPSGALTQQSGTSAFSFGNATFITNNAAITLNNTGNNFGGLTLSTGETASGTQNVGTGSATINYSEDNTVRLISLDNKGNSTLTSRTGSVIETPTAAVSIQSNVLTVNATNGSINIGGTTQSGGGTLAGNITTFIANAPGGAVNVKVTAGNLTLGNITALSLSVNSTTANGNLSQSGVANIYGNSNFTSGGNIIISNTSNNFGRLSLTTTAAKNITVTENGTLNLGKVAMGGAGNVIITSQNGDIVDSGLLGVVMTSANVVTLNASGGKGNITLTNPTTKLDATNGVIFNGNNVVFSPLSAIILGNNSTTSVANGNLSVSAPTGTITESGNVTVKGNAVFQTGNQDIILTQAGNQFGQVQFQGKVVQVTQSTDMKIMTNSSATGAAQLISSGGNISIVNTGGSAVSFSSTAFLSAGNQITLPKLVSAADTLIVSAPGTKDLSALSISGDLGGKSPINTGTGSYSAPQP